MAFTFVFLFVYLVQCCGAVTYGKNTNILSFDSLLEIENFHDDDKASSGWGQELDNQNSHIDESQRQWAHTTPSKSSLSLSRSLLSTVTVDVFTQIDFQLAINDAKLLTTSETIIEVKNSIYIERTLNVSQINTPLTVNGNGFELNGNHSSQIMYVAHSLYIVFNNLTFTNGYSDVGSGVSVLVSTVKFSHITFSHHQCRTGCGVLALRSSLLFQDSSFISNNATQQGAAVFLYMSATLIQRCNFNSNLAHYGGAAIIGYYGVLTLESSLISRNKVMDRYALYSVVAGAIFALNMPTVVLSNSTFSDCLGDDDGSCFVFESSSCSISNCSFSNSIAQGGGNGGAVIGYIGNLTMENTVFNNNTADNTGGAFNFFSGNVMITNTHFSNNRALTQGGAAGFEYATGTIKNCLFSNNEARYGGGGLIVVASSVLTFLDCIMIDNKAEFGGGIMVSDYGTQFWCSSCLISRNQVLQSGGGIYVQGGTTQLKNSTLSSNIAQSATFNMTLNSSTACSTYGGCIFSGNFPLPYDQNERCRFIAGEDGVLTVNTFSTELSTDVLTINGVSFSGSVGPSGLAIYKGDVLDWVTDGFVQLSGFDICYSTTANGGGVYVTGDITELDISNSTLLSNIATRYGGGIYSEGGSTFIDEVLIQYNEAGLGGYDIEFVAGTLNAKDLKLPDIDSSDAIGGGSIQGATCVSSCGLGYSGSCDVSEAASQCFVNCQCHKCDAGYYSDILGSTSSSDCTSCTAGYISSNGASSCSACSLGKFATINETDGGLSNPLVEAATTCQPCPKGLYTMLPASIICQSCGAGTTSEEGNSSCYNCPGGKYASSSGASSCLACSAGTYSEEGSSRCISCPNGYDSNKGSSSCLLAESGYYIDMDSENSFITKECPSNAYCYGGKFGPIPNSGYWVDRSSYHFSDIILKCSSLNCISATKEKYSNNTCWKWKNYNKTNSGGGTVCNTNDLQCLVGSQGPLCGSCIPGYIFKGEINKCEKCTTSASFAISFLSLLLFTALLALIWHYFPKSLVPTFIHNIILFILSFESGPLKVLWVTYQIIVSVRWNLDTIFPSPFSNMFNFLSIFSFDFLSLECFSNNHTFYFTVYWWSMIPILICLISVVILGIRIWFLYQFNLALGFIYLNDDGKREKHSNSNVILSTTTDITSTTTISTNDTSSIWNNQQNKIETSRQSLSDQSNLKEKSKSILDQHVYFILFLSYIVLPAASMKQLQSFDCITISQKKYLRVDTSIDCQSDSYMNFRASAIVFVMIYQSIPILWFLLLYRQKKELIPQSNPQHDSFDQDMFIEARNKNSNLASIRFLFKDYKYDKWWFEIADLYRRIIFVGVLPLVSNIPATKASFGCLLSVLSIVYFREEQPYHSDRTNSLAYIAQFTILLTFYGALSIETGVMLTFGLSGSSLGFALVIINLVVFSAVLLMTWRRYKQTQEESRWARSLTEHEYDIVNSIMSCEAFDLYQGSSQSGGGGGGGGGAVSEESIDYQSGISMISTRFNTFKNTKSNLSGHLSVGTKPSTFTTNNVLPPTTATTSQDESPKLSPSQDGKVDATKVLAQHLLPSKDIVIKKRLGAGAFGEVFKGTCMGEPVAIKTMLDITKDNVKEFRAEILLTATLRHPNIVNFVGACWGRELICMVLEWVSNGSLSDFCDRGGGVVGLHELEWEDPLLRLATDIARGMNYLHTRSYYDEQEGEMKSCVLHRDLKPDNVLVSEFIAGKISDFGTSRAKGAEDVVMTGVGTPLFVAPELMRGEYYDEKVDVYSFGLTLLIMTISDPILDFIGDRFMKHFNKKKIPKQPMRLIRPMTDDGWRPVTAEHPIEFAPPSINNLIIQCCNHDPVKRPNFEHIYNELMTTVKKEVVDDNGFKQYSRQSVLLKQKQQAVSRDGEKHQPLEVETGLSVSSDSSSGGTTFTVSSSVAARRGSKSSEASSVEGPAGKQQLDGAGERLSQVENPMRAI